MTLSCYSAPCPTSFHAFPRGWAPTFHPSNHEPRVTAPHSWLRSDLTRALASPINARRHPGERSSLHPPCRIANFRSTLARAEAQIHEAPLELKLLCSCHLDPWFFHTRHPECLRPPRLTLSCDAFVTDMAKFSVKAIPFPGPGPDSDPSNRDELGAP